MTDDLTAMLADLRAKAEAIMRALAKVLGGQQ